MLKLEGISVSSPTIRNILNMHGMGGRYDRLLKLEAQVGDKAIELTLVARALAQQALVVILDEPTAHLDLRHQDVVLKLIRALADEQNLAILLTLHDLNLVARFCDRVALLSDGGVRKLGPPAEVLTPGELAAVYGIEIHVVSHPIHGTPLILPG